MTCQCRSMSRTFAASSTQRLVSQAQGHSGSNQKSTRAFVGALCTASVIGLLLAFVGRPIAPGLAATANPDRGALVPALGGDPRWSAANAVVPAWEAARRGRTQPDPHRRRRPRRTPDRAELRPPARPHRRRRAPRRAHLPVRRRPSSSAAGEPGRRRRSSTWSPRRVRSATLNGVELDVSTLHRGRAACRCPAWPSRTRSSSTPTAATPTPARACTASSTRRTGRSTSTPSSSRPTPSGCSPASTSPTSRPPSRCT